MPNKKRRCLHCKDYANAESGIVTPVGFFHDMGCAFKYGSDKSKKAMERQIAKGKKEFNQETKRLRKGLMTRSDWYEKLQRLVNQYVVKVRDVDEGCFTCGTTADVKYDAGHCFPQGNNWAIRFELTNIHKQCSVKCNQHGSGMRHEYESGISDKYGAKHLAWLKGPHDDLKCQFPHVSDIENEIKRYRKLLREAGITPRA